MQETSETREGGFPAGFCSVLVFFRMFLYVNCMFVPLTFARVEIEHAYCPRVIE
jgi:hypothetical protein